MKFPANEGSGLCRVQLRDILLHFLECDFTPGKEERSLVLESHGRSWGYNLSLLKGVYYAKE